MSHVARCELDALKELRAISVRASGGKRESEGGRAGAAARAGPDSDRVASGEGPLGKRTTSI